MGRFAAPPHPPLRGTFSRKGRRRRFERIAYTLSPCGRGWRAAPGEGGGESRKPRLTAQKPAILIAMEITLFLLAAAILVFFLFRGKKSKARDEAAEAARKAVEARLDSGAAAQRDEDSRA